ncbi:MAG: outer membrane beta-barrel protein [Bacteroidetes bacterium]|nr:outer membrane beta-barrel protein [Bacteroidota bacterium]
MKNYKHPILFSFLLLSVIYINNIYAQDSIITSNNYKYKLGAKLIADKSGDIAISPFFYQVYCGGMQIIKRIKTSKMSLESGVYYYNKVYENRFYSNSHPVTLYLPFYYHYLNLPLSLRYDTKLFYFTAGGYVDYLTSTTLDPENKEYKDSIIDNGPNRKINLGIAFSVGLEKQISKQINFFVEGHLLQNFSSTKLGIHNILPSMENYGFAIGINYKMKLFKV